MSKFVTIPVEFGFPSVDVWVNGTKYSYPTGEKVLVPDSVAEILLTRYSALPVPEPENPFSVPKSLVVHAVVDSKDVVTADKSHREILDAYKSGTEVFMSVDYHGSKVPYGPYEFTLPLSSVITSKESPMYNTASVMFSGVVDGAGITYSITIGTGNGMSWLINVLRIESY